MKDQRKWQPFSSLVCGCMCEMALLTVILEVSVGWLVSVRVCVCMCASMYSYLCEIEKQRGAEILRGSGSSVFVKLKTDQRQNLLYFMIACDIEKK